MRRQEGRGNPEPGWRHWFFKKTSDISSIVIRENKKKQAQTGRRVGGCDDGGVALFGKILFHFCSFLSAEVSVL